MDSVIQRWAKNFGIVVYLNEDLNKKEENALKNRFLKDKDIIEVKYISKEEALKELHKTLGANALVLEGLDENPLPSSFELRLKSSLIKPGLVKNKAEIGRAHV